jgi:hypothetical protein
MTGPDGTLPLERGTPCSVPHGGTLLPGSSVPSRSGTRSRPRSNHPTAPNANGRRDPIIPAAVLMALSISAIRQAALQGHP